jgi:hypothetical protein
MLRARFMVRREVLRFHRTYLSWEDIAARSGRTQTRGDEQAVPRVTRNLLRPALTRDLQSNVQMTSY